MPQQVPFKIMVMSSHAANLQMFFFSQAPSSPCSSLQDLMDEDDEEEETVGQIPQYAEPVNLDIIYIYLYLYIYIYIVADSQ